MIESTNSSRRLSPKKRGSQVGWIVDPFRRRQIVFESDLKQKCAYVLVASTDVALVEDQPYKVAFTLEDGRSSHHTFDFRLTLTDGKRVAIAVKYVADVEKTGIREVLELIASQRVGQGFAEEFRVMTEDDLDDLRVGNAHLVVSCGSDFDPEGQSLVMAFLAKAPERFCLAHVGRETGLGSRGYRAAVALFQAGVLSLETRTAITPDAVVVNRLSTLASSLGGPILPRPADYFREQLR